MIEARKNGAFERLFSVYTKRLLMKNFNGIHIRGEENFLKRDANIPTIIYANHSNWWDAIIPFYLSYDVFKVDAYAMMEYKQLRKYKFFRRIGVFSVDRESRTGAYRSFKYAQEILKEPKHVLWIYPQGVLLHNDTRPLMFEHGLARLIKEVKRVNTIPMAFSYEYVKEQRPEVFITVFPHQEYSDAEEVNSLNTRLESILTEGLDSQKRKIISRNFTGYRTLMEGRKSAGSIMNRGDND